MVMPRLPRQLNDPSPTRARNQKDHKKKNRKRVKLGVASVFNRRPCTDGETGIVYQSRKEMMTARKVRHSLMLTDFAQMVADQTLGLDPWEHLPVESTIQYERFRHYLLTPRGKKRSVVQTAAAFGVGPTTLSRVAQKYSWTLRAQYWDKYMDQQEQEEFVEAKRVAVRRQAKLGQKLQDLALRGATNMLATGGVDLSPGDVARLADTGVKIERLAHDKSTSNEARQQATTLVWDGPSPKWATHSEEVVVEHQVEAGELTTRVRRLEVDNGRD